MEEYYLVCRRCNGYYHLDDEESPDEFSSCQCGGELVLVNDLNEYFNDRYYKKPKSGLFNLKKTTLFILFLIIMIPSFFLYSGGLGFINSDLSLIEGHNLLGSDNRGYVIKDVYGLDNATKTIAIVTGIHPRETLSKNVTSNLISNYKLAADSKIIHYNIKVTNNPNDFTEGRNSGEGLAADYIMPDILKTNSDLIIICHDHRQGYGQGFYIATPEMDQKSVKLAEMVNKSIPGFRYYKSDTNAKSSSSAVKFSKPLANAGYPTFVYEIPEWYSYNEVYKMTENFIGKCFSFI